MLVIDDVAEQAIIDDDTNIPDLNGGPPGAFMLGLFYKSASGQWEWATGEVLDQVALGVTFDVDADEYCARTVRSANSRWKTRACNDSEGSIETICELDGRPLMVQADR